jgi:hypothetical protein
MKRLHAVIIAAGLLTGCSAAWGQNPAALKAEIPFDFVVDGTIARAGTYKFQDTGMRNVLGLVDSGNRWLKLMPGIPVGNPNGTQAPRVVFLKQGATYTLSQVWMNGRPGCQFNQPKSDPGHVHVAINLSR